VKQTLSCAQECACFVLISETKHDEASFVCVATQAFQK